MSISDTVGHRITEGGGVGGWTFKQERWVHQLVGIRNQGVTRNFVKGGGGWRFGEKMDN